MHLYSVQWSVLILFEFFILIKLKQYNRYSVVSQSFSNMEQASCCFVFTGLTREKVPTARFRGSSVSAPVSGCMHLL